MIFSFSGSGVFATKFFRSGDFLLEYTGELIDERAGEERQSATKDDMPSYFYFFQHEQKRIW